VPDIPLSPQRTHWHAAHVRPPHPKIPIPFDHYYFLSAATGYSAPSSFTRRMNAPQHMRRTMSSPCPTNTIPPRTRSCKYISLCVRLPSQSSFSTSAWVHRPLVAVITLTHAMFHHPSFGVLSPPAVLS
jgi:hypothetical protein